MTCDKMIAEPGDPDLDTHVSCLRITAVIVTATDVAEVVVSYDTSDAAGWWRDETGGRYYPDGITELTSCFGLQPAPGSEHLVGLLIGRLERWRDHRTLIEMTGAPGKWTRLHGPDPATGNDTEVIHPRGPRPGDPRGEPCGQPGRTAAREDLLRQVPGPVRKLLFLTCPRCGHRTWNRGGSEYAGYQAHYLNHLIDDLQETGSGS